MFTLHRTTFTEIAVNKFLQRNRFNMCSSLWNILGTVSKIKDGAVVGMAQ